MSREQTPQFLHGGQYGDMHFSLDAAVDIAPWANCRKAGFVLPDDRFSFTGWREDLSEAATDLLISIYDEMDDYSGEVVARTTELTASLGVSAAILQEAIDELLDCEALDGAVRQGSLIIFTVPIAHNPHYGDDLNPEPDFMGDLASEGDVEDDDPFTPEIELGVTPLPPPSNPKRARVYAKTNGWCFYCITVPAREIDHMHPRIRGGGNKDENLIGACKACNVRKKDRTVEEFRAYLAHRNRYPDIGMVRFYGERFQ